MNETETTKVARGRKVRRTIPRGTKCECGLRAVVRQRKSYAPHDEEMVCRRHERWN